MNKERDRSVQRQTTPGTDCVVNRCQSVFGFLKTHTQTLWVIIINTERPICSAVISLAVPHTPFRLPATPTIHINHRKKHIDKKKK